MAAAPAVSAAPTQIPAATSTPGEFTFSSTPPAPQDSAPVRKAPASQDGILLVGRGSRDGGGRAARYKRIAQAYYRSRLAARGAAKEEGKPARRLDPARDRAYRQVAMAYQAAMRAQKPHSQPDSDDIAARFERDDRTVAAWIASMF